jgi:hypothetical protein
MQRPRRKGHFEKLARLLSVPGAGISLHPDPPDELLWRAHRPAV